MEKARHLFVLDEHQETEDVLRAVLEPTGTSVTRVRNWRQLKNYEPKQEESVLVLHSDESLEAHPEAKKFAQVPRVIIGRAETGTPKGTPPEKSFQTNAREHQLEEMFEFKDLLRAIDSLWRSDS